jgi:type IV pilus assembly protein PilC
MAEFLVKMADERGHVLQQVESGVSEQEIRERFVQQGFMVYSVKTRRGLLPIGVGARKKILKADQFVIFNQQFLTLIKAGLPILKSLNILSKRQKNPRFKAILDNVQ